MYVGLCCDVYVCVVDLLSLGCVVVLYRWGLACVVRDCGVLVCDGVQLLRCYVM